MILQYSIEILFGLIAVVMRTGINPPDNWDEYIEAYVGNILYGGWFALLAWGAGKSAGYQDCLISNGIIWSR